MFTAEERRKYIGGSDIASILGMSRWKTPFTLWLEKTGEVEPSDLSDNEAVQLGTELEEFVAQKFSRVTGLKVRKRTAIYTHKKYPFLAAHVDRLIVGTDELLECKTCSSYKAEEWEDIIVKEEIDGKIVEKVIEKIPQEYLLQVMWYLGITNKKRGYIAVLIGGQKFKYRKIDFDAELFDSMLKAAIEFWNCVEKKLPPAFIPSDNELLVQIYPQQEENAEFINDQKQEKLIDRLQKIKSKRAELKEKQDLIEARLKNIINTHAGIMTEKYKVSWQTGKTSTIRTFRVYENKKKAA